ncbi:MAG TPA: N-acetyl-alpha-D-glucosaminyl L-malate synthase BshA [Pyrinomonadaceae bacterium]|jgi:N-acetyl-alpha-D-glucosaminyl L-malate synthase BshA|nr:N-acetyl-alpha-D-glucosaminyl L-malate synthase BshA [Pyrinomonadaceae bacterium]
MNIGITVYPTYGGSGIVGAELGRELAALGHNVHFISSVLPTRVTELNERVHFHEVEMMTYPLFEHQPYDLALATKMATVARAEKLDLLHVHYAIPHSISAILARESIKEKRFVPVITTLHGTDITLVGADRSYLPITRYALQQSDGVTAVSRFLKQATIETFDFDNIEVIPNFICSEQYKKLTDSPLRDEIASNGELLLAHVSNFRSVKRPTDCIEILARVKKEFANVKLVMVGDGPERSAVAFRAEQLGVKDDVAFVGKRSNIAGYLGVSDVFLLPSELESFGLAALEAQACELPVIATRIGGIPEVINDGETGYLSEIGDIDKMAADTLRLLNDDDLRSKFGTKGRELAIQRYSIEKIVPQYVAYYEKIVAISRAAAA